MKNYNFYLEEIGSALRHLEELEETNRLLEKENSRLRKELKKYGQMEYPDPRQIVDLMAIFNLKNVRIADRELLPRGTVRKLNFISNDYLRAILRREDGSLKISEFSELMINKKMYDVAKFFRYHTEDERTIALCIVLCEHYFGIQFDLPDKVEIVWGTKTAYKLRWFTEVLRYVGIYRENLIFND